MRPRVVAVVASVLVQVTAGLVVARRSPVVVGGGGGGSSTVWTGVRSPTRSTPRMALGLGALGELARQRRTERAVTTVERRAYDYILVGGGAAGCVLANRLSADGTKQVLLVEAGTASPSHPLVRVPVAILKLFKSKWDWNHATEPSASTAGRPLYLCRGKGVGGSSNTNVMLYTRGSAADYDGWAEACGDASWASGPMLEYFKKAERCVSEDVGPGSAYHGYDGVHAVSDVPYQNEMSRAFVAAAGDEHPAQWGRSKDFNDWSKPQRGFGRYQVAQSKGVRVTAYSAYLTPDVLKRPNLAVVAGATANCVAFDGTRAIGVDLSVGGDEGGGSAPRRSRTGKMQPAKARLSPGGEVISTSGAIGSPQLLLLSGVGARDELIQNAIRPVVDLPGVGRGLQDHPAALVSFTGTERTKGRSHSSALRLRGTTLTNPLAAAKWLASGTGPLTSPGCDHGGFVPSSDGDVQFRFLATKTISPDGMSTIADGYKAARDHPDGFTIQAIAARPKSRSGRVTLRSADPFEKAKIEDLYLTDRRDVVALVAAIKLGREIAAQPALAAFRGAEEFPGDWVTEDADLEDYVRDTVHSANALVGTCRLGTADQPDAVVDSHLRVLGTTGLRVADASVMPTLPGGQTCSSTIALAEKAADLILRGH